MRRLSTLWSNAIAYIALLTGSGLSVAGNVADTFRTRGPATDALDIILAGAWPILVILTIEIFVSSRWARTPAFQALRWFGCLAVGNLAMLVSWLHLHDLMASRGQLPLVAMAGPLAIDSLAIMATGLIVSTRGRLAKVATWTGPVATAQDVAESEAAFAGWTGQDEHWLSRIGAELDSTTTPAISLAKPVRVSNEIRPDSVPADAADLIMAWHGTSDSERPPASTVDALIGHEFTVSTRTARRWRDALVSRTR